MICFIWDVLVLCGFKQLVHFTFTFKFICVDLSLLFPSYLFKFIVSSLTVWVFRFIYFDHLSCHIYVHSVVHSIFLLPFNVCRICSVFSLSFLMLLVMYLLFSLLASPRDLPVLLIFSKNTFLLMLIFSIFIFVKVCLMTQDMICLGECSVYTWKTCVFYFW